MAASGEPRPHPRLSRPQPPSGMDTKRHRGMPSSIGEGRGQGYGHGGSAGL